MRLRIHLTEFVCAFICLRTFIIVSTKFTVFLHIRVINYKCITILLRNRLIECMCFEIILRIRLLEFMCFYLFLRIRLIECMHLFCMFHRFVLLVCNLVRSFVALYVVKDMYIYTYIYIYSIHVRGFCAISLHSFVSDYAENHIYSMGLSCVP